MDYFGDHQNFSMATYTITVGNGAAWTDSQVHGQQGFMRFWWLTLTRKNGAVNAVLGRMEQHLEQQIFLQ